MSAFHHHQPCEFSQEPPVQVLVFHHAMGESVMLSCVLWAYRIGERDRYQPWDTRPLALTTLTIATRSDAASTNKLFHCRSNSNAIRKRKKKKSSTYSKTRKTPFQNRIFCERCDLPLHWIFFQSNGLKCRFVGANSKLLILNLSHALNKFTREWNETIY